MNKPSAETNEPVAPTLTMAKIRLLSVANISAGSISNPLDRRLSFMISLIGYIPSSAETDIARNRPARIKAVASLFIMVDSSFTEFPAPGRGGG